MKNYVMILFLCLLISCTDRKQINEELERREEMSQDASKSEIGTEAVTEEVTESLGLIGEWNIPSAFGGGELKIEHQFGKYYKIEELSDGTVNIAQMELMEEGGLKIFRLKDKSSDETWVITDIGGLEVRGKDGLIYSSKAI
jgi:hypothetical protein